ncbi:hypothetical protein LTR10_008054 [Elasticomyces elasticus]|nr:hypothetical protein LTR10_008054 [Elasticomyces elasticus]KAK4971052.1 hypothetical protein LTR42_008031 [Elasticomyces elasticus]
MAQTNTAAATSCDQSTTFIYNLFKLPAELRLQIYGLIVVKPGCGSVETHLSSEWAKIRGHIILPSLMRISKMIRDNAIGLYRQHLQEARVVLIGRERNVEKRMWIANMAYRTSVTHSVPGVSLLWLGRVDRYSEQLEDNRKWIVRVDQLAAQVTGSA